ncbi:helix-turn-helix domain-containing protein [Streptomyces sp. Z423-1]|uniref:helix-turn-helix domain-containing protein n=1 Tax=unclassified Streptomyces TaxID=2593676 RepID=UPI0014899A1D|nr:helix-turn-helix domain-containing protein [Streptomyces sp. Z423-1]
MANQHTNGVTDEERAAIRRLHAEGKGRNEISRLIGRSLRTISVQAAKMNLTFDRTATEAATKARIADLAEKRAILAEALTDDALQLTEQLWQPGKVFSFGGKDNIYREKPVEQPPALDKKNLMAAAGIAIEKSLRLVPPETETGEEDARSMLGKMMTGLQQVWNEQQAGRGDEGDDAS